MHVIKVLRFMLLAIATMLLIGVMLAQHFSISAMVFVENQAGVAAIFGFASMVLTLVYASIKRKRSL